MSKNSIPWSISPNLQFFSILVFNNTLNVNIVFSNYALNFKFYFQNLIFLFTIWILCRYVLISIIFTFCSCKQKKMLLYSLRILVFQDSREITSFFSKNLITPKYVINVVQKNRWFTELCLYINISQTIVVFTSMKISLTQI